jgi:hypothetical protein
MDNISEIHQTHFPNNTQQFSNNTTMNNNTIKHKDIVAKVAKQVNLPQELVHTVALAYLDTMLTIATIQGHLSIENILSISVSVSTSTKKINKKSLNNLKHQQHKSEQSEIQNPQSEIHNPQSEQSQIKHKASIKVKFHQKVIQNVISLYESSFSPQTINQIIASMSNTLNNNLQQIKNATLPPASPTTNNPQSKQSEIQNPHSAIHNPQSEIQNPKSQDLQTKTSFEHILTLDQIAKKT